MDKYSEKILKRIREDYRKRRMDAKDDGKWRTTEEGDHIHFNEQGEIDKGNPYVVSAMSKSGTKTSASMRESVEKARKRVEERKQNRYKAKPYKPKKSTVGREENGLGTESHGPSESVKAEGGENTQKKMPKAKMTSDITGTKSGVQYPKLENGAKWTFGLEEAEKTAYKDESVGKNGEPPMVEPGSYDRTIKNMPREKIIYQKDSEGNVIASIPGLAAMSDNVIKGSEKVKNAFNDYVNDSMIATNDMLDIAKENGMYMMQLENCVKSASHFENKLKKIMVQKDLSTPEEALERITDGIRFTAMVDNDRYVEGVNKFIGGLENKGYEIVEVDNKYMKNGQINDDATYKAVHILAKNKSGKVIEVQIHSPESVYVKSLTHEPYGEQNKMKEKKKKEDFTDEENARYNKLEDDMIKIWRENYTNPSDIESIRSFKK